MKWIHVKALFESDDIVFGEDIVSDMFFSLGLQGVVCQVPLEAPPEGFGSDALPIPDETWVSGYIPDTDASLLTLANIRKRAKELEHLNIKVVIQTQVVDQEDWAESWKNFFHVSRITQRMVIKPAWREFNPNIDDIVIEIDPGMAFGTGTHPTTAMCLTLIEKYVKTGDRFLDVGTGSGILMIAAAKLGASHLVGIDTDEVAVQVATENLIKNGISYGQFYVEHSTLDNYLKKIDSHPKNHLQNYGSKDSHPNDHLIEKHTLIKENHNLLKFDLIVANIIAEVLCEIMLYIKESIKVNGTLILSGIIKERENTMIKSLNEIGFSILEVKSDGEWVAIVAKQEESV